MSNIEVLVEPADHLDWIDITVVGPAWAAQYDEYSVITVRGMSDLYRLKEAIDQYIWRHEGD
jgi:hypothetical protein